MRVALPSPAGHGLASGIQTRGACWPDQRPNRMSIAFLELKDIISQYDICCRRFPKAHFQK
jgi:hypothetical protein